MKAAFAILKEKYREIADLTRPKCLGECSQPGTCCKATYCGWAEARAREFGVKLERQPHPTLPYMGEGGCVVPPYLRPLCAVHVCEALLMENPGFAEVYLALREEVSRIEEEAGPSWPRGMARTYWE